MINKDIQLFKSSNGKTSTISMLYCDEDTDIHLKNRNYQMYHGDIVLCHPDLTWASTNKIIIISFNESFLILYFIVKLQTVKLFMILSLQEIHASMIIYSLRLIPPTISKICSNS